MLTLASNCRHVPAHIEPEPFDDAEGDGFAPLERWGDRAFREWNDRINELIHAATE